MELKGSVIADATEGSTGSVNKLVFHVSNAAAGEAIDLSQGNTIIRYTDPAQSVNLNTATEFSVDDMGTGHALGRAISLFVENAPSVTSVGEKTSYNVGRIGGGTSINSIAFESWMEVDMRSGRQDKLDDIDAVMQAAVEQALQEENAARLDGPELSVDVERVGTRPAAKGDTQSAIVQRAIAATQAFGIEPDLRISSTDANLPLSIGVPAVTMSRGGVSGNSHAPEEWWQNKDGHIGMQIGLITLLAEAGLAD